MSSNLAIYIHWPFCKSKCPYCDFNSHVRENISMEKWLKSYLEEIDYFSKKILDKKITSIFFGGGTPSLMDPAITAAIINKLAELGTIDKSTEITLEANPTSMEIKKFEQFSTAGINRVSIGIQALNNQDLQFLGREHNADQAIEALAMAKSIFERYSFDLIYARPHQTAYAWQVELESALELAGRHLSLYQLTIEKGTPFYKQYQNKHFTLPNEIEAVKLYELTQKIMNLASLPAYEVSNHASIGEESRHNLSYWQYSEYLGIGPGAHSRIKSDEGGGYDEMVMISSPESWLRSIEQKGCGVQMRKALTRAQMAEEKIMMGLRLATGINLADFYQLVQRDLFEIVNKHKLARLLDQGLLSLSDESISVTPSGSLVLNRVIGELLS